MASGLFTWSTTARISNIRSPRCNIPRLIDYIWLNFGILFSFLTLFDIMILCKSTLMLIQIRNHRFSILNGSAHFVLLQARPLSDYGKENGISCSILLFTCVFLWGKSLGCSYENDSYYSINTSMYSSIKYQQCRGSKGRWTRIILQFDIDTVDQEILPVPVWLYEST